MDQQPSPEEIAPHRPVVYPNGSTVKWMCNKRIKLNRVISRDMNNTFKVYMYTIHVLGSTNNDNISGTKRKLYDEIFRIQQANKGNSETLTTSKHMKHSRLDVLLNTELVQSCHQFPTEPLSPMLTSSKEYYCITEKFTYTVNNDKCIQKYKDMQTTRPCKVQAQCHKRTPLRKSELQVHKDEQPRQSMRETR